MMFRRQVLNSFQQTRFFSFSILADQIQIQNLYLQLVEKADHLHNLLMQKPTLFFSVFLFLLVSCCKKDTSTVSTPQLPPETQQGKNTFGCLVDGEVWLPKGSISIQALTADYSNGDFFVLAQYGSLSAIRINMNSLFVPGDYILNNNSSQHYVYYVQQGDVYNPDSMHTGMVTFKKLDTINYIISGTFYFDAVNSVGEIKHITEGRFDLKY